MNDTPTSARKAWPHIKLKSGQWYAFSDRGERRTRNTLLSRAIGFCRRLNQLRKQS